MLARAKSCTAPAGVRTSSLEVYISSVKGELSLIGDDIFRSSWLELLLRRADGPTACKTVIKFRQHSDITITKIAKIDNIHL